MLTHEYTDMLTLSASHRTTAWQKRVDELVRQKYLKTPSIVDAFRSVERKNFVPKDIEELADDDIALPIGYGATISQPLTVAFMLEELQAEAGDKVLDIGSGSGWTSALLAHIVGDAGRIYGVEIVSELCDRADEMITEQYPELARRIEFISENAEGGLPEYAPYQKIMASAAVDKIPVIWQEQLAIGGTLVAPVRQSIVSEEKVSPFDFRFREFPGFLFVPFVSR